MAEETGLKLREVVHTEVSEWRENGKETEYLLYQL